MFKNITLLNLKKYWKIILTYIVIETILLDNFLFELIPFFSCCIITEFLIGTIFFVLFIYFLDKYMDSKK